jgi:starvation-inducible DNA-binding protein
LVLPIRGITIEAETILFDKHYEEQNAIVDAIAERIQLLGGVSIAMAHDVADMTQSQAPQGAGGSTGSDFATAARA